MTNVTVRADEQLKKAREASSGRSSYMAVHDGPLRQTLIALTAGNELAEHNAPPAASVFVLRGRVRLAAGDDVAELSAGALVTVPRQRHSLAAAEDSVVLLTTIAD
ncbi:MAG TPA: cupin [Streptosporangiaceae bacterium]|jgi:quercetin dioxygenase-like cupin family protein